MASIQFLDSNTTGCKGAVLPTVIQEAEVVFDTATDGTIPTVITGGATGDAAPYGGTFINKGCSSITATITYLSGATCDPCDTETIVPVDVPWVIQPNTVSEIPSGYWTQISYVLDTAATDLKTQSVSFQSCYTADCVECQVALP